jgi:hypothetical protein
MKRSLFSNRIKHAALAVPAAALMLGAAHAGTTVGLNFQAWYYDSGTTPQTIGYGQGYQTTGWPVTANAFGLGIGSWINTDPLDCSSALDTTVTMGSVSAQLTTVNMWSGDIGNLVDPANEWTPGYASTVTPGNDEVTWGYEDNTGWTNYLSGLNTDFPNGYVIELIGTVKCTANSRVVVSDGVTTTTNAFDTIYTAGNVNFSGPVGLLAITGTSDTLTFGAASRSINSAQSCALAGFIITDQPVVSKGPGNASVNLGGTLTLTASVFGLTNGLNFQWRHYGTNLPAPSSATYTKVGVTEADAGDYDLVVTNLYGSTTSSVATVTVIAVPSITKDLAGMTGTIYSGANFAQWSIIAAGGQPLHYTWLKNGSTPVGTDSPTLTLNNVSVSDGGKYSVTVTNSFGSITSQTNQLNVVASPDLYTTDVAQDSPGAYWPLKEASGTEASDYSGLAHAGTNNGGMTQGVNGPRPPAYQGFTPGKTAYQFDGFTSFIDCGTGPALVGETDFTVEAWINTTATTDGRIIQQRDAAGFNGQYMLTALADGRIGFVVYGGGYQFNMSSPNSINDGKWHHVAAVRRNGTNGVIYIDGTAVATATSSPIAPLLPTLVTYIGSDQRDHNNYFAGTLSDVATYPYALSASRIALHAYTGLLGNSGFSVGMIPGGFIEDTKPIGALHLGMNTLSTWVNSSTDTGGGSMTRTGVEVFSGNGMITTPADPDFNSTTGTIMFWLRASAPIPGPGAEAAMLFDRRTTNGTVITLNDGGSIFVQCHHAANSLAAGYLPDNNWHHVAVTYDQSASGSLEIFIDGLSAGSQPNTTDWAWPTSQQLELGRSHDPYWKALNGELDDFRIYNRVLTATEIASIQSSDAVVDPAALKVRYNFDTAPVGTSLTWPVGSLQSSPSLGTSAVWTNVPGAVSPYPFLPPSPVVPSGPALFYRAGF